MEVGGELLTRLGGVWRYSRTLAHTSMPSCSGAEHENPERIGQLRAIGSRIARGPRITSNRVAARRSPVAPRSRPNAHAPERHDQDRIELVVVLDIESAFHVADRHRGHRDDDLTRFARSEGKESPTIDLDLRQ